MSGWRADILGDGFEQRSLVCRPDDEGEVEATLVRALPDPPEPPARPNLWQRLTRFTRSPQPTEERTKPFDSVDVLYVHGWSDYFFQTDLAQFWADRGARFYALDLRKYGRSLREGQTPGYAEDLSVYDEEIALALDVMRNEPGAEGRTLVLLGHSTGGLVLSLWAHRHPGIADAMVLNSPWLEFQLSGAMRKVLLPLVQVSARFSAREAAPQIDLGFYARAQQEVAEPGSVQSINEAWRPPQSLPVRAGWLRAIMAGHDTISHGLNIQAPVCVLLSARSVVPTKWSDELLAADSVLNVAEVARAALHLGPSVTVERIDGALHDVFVSAPTPRRDAYTRMERWITGFLAAHNPAPMP